jgi:hypothetical protein
MIKRECNEMAHTPALQSAETEIEYKMYSIAKKAAKEEVDAFSTPGSKRARKERRGLLPPARSASNCSSDSNSKYFTIPTSRLAPTISKPTAEQLDFATLKRQIVLEFELAGAYYIFYNDSSATPARSKKRRRAPRSKTPPPTNDVASTTVEKAVKSTEEFHTATYARFNPLSKAGDLVFEVRDSTYCLCHLSISKAGTNITFRCPRRR